MTASSAVREDNRPNVLILVGTGHASRFLGHADGPRAEPVETPTLDGLASRGASFATAYTPMPVQAPAKAAILTGRSPLDIGILNGPSTLPSDVPTIATRFGASGYRTCLVGSLGIGGDEQFAGFQDRPYGDFTGTGGHQYDPLTEIMARGSPNNAASSATGGRYGHHYDPISRDRSGPDDWRSLAGDAGETDIPESRHQERTVAREALSWLRETVHEDPDSPWLLLASFSRPHPPLTAPRRYTNMYNPSSESGVTDPAVGGESDVASHPFVEAKADDDRTSTHGDSVVLDSAATRRARAGYFASISYLDEVLDDFLATLERDGNLENTVVVYVSERGNLAGEHDLWWSGSFHEGAIRVPLIVVTPEHRRGGNPATRFETPISLVDLAPTLYTLADVEAAPTDGTDLTDSIRTASEPRRGPVSVDFPLPWYGDGTQFRAVRDGDWKYVRFHEAPDLGFNLATDPHEMTARDPSVVDDAIREHAASVDFDEISQRHTPDSRGGDNRAAAISNGTTGNAYLLDDGRLLDADVTLYKPDILASDTARVFSDHPENRDA